MQKIVLVGTVFIGVIVSLFRLVIGREQLTIPEEGMAKAVTEQAWAHPRMRAAMAVTKG